MFEKKADPPSAAKHAPVHADPKAEAHAAPHAAPAKVVAPYDGPDRRVSAPPPISPA